MAKNKWLPVQLTSVYWIIPFGGSAGVSSASKTFPKLQT